MSPGEAPRHASIWPRVGLLALALVAVTVVLATDVLGGPLDRLLALTERTIAANPGPGAALFVAFAALSGMLAFFSSAVVTPVAVHAWGPVFTALLLWVGWVLGAALTYVIGRVVGRPVAGLVAPAKLARYEHTITREAPFGLVVLFQMATPSEVPGYLLGIVRYSFLRYIVVVAVSELPYAIGTVVLGESFIKRQIVPFVLLGAVAIAFSAWAYVRLNRRLVAAAAVAPSPASRATAR